MLIHLGDIFNQNLKSLFELNELVSFQVKYFINNENEIENKMSKNKEGR